MVESTAKVRRIDSSYPVHHLVNQPVRGYVAGQRVSPEIASKSALRLVPGTNEQLTPVVRTGRAADARKVRLKVLDVAFFVVALGAAAAMWWSVTVN